MERDKLYMLHSFYKSTYKTVLLFYNFLDFFIIQNEHNISIMSKHNIFFMIRKKLNTPKGNSLKAQYTSEQTFLSLVVLVKIIFFLPPTNFGQKNFFS